MATYTFKRGKFGRWSTPMWAGETRAFKLIRLLIKQGVKGIKYEEGPLCFYTIHDMVRNYRLADFDPYRYCGYKNILESVKKATANMTTPEWFRVSF